MKVKSRRPASNAALHLDRCCCCRVVLAIPVGAGSSVSNLKGVADEVVALSAPEPFMAVGQWYRDFAQTEDSEVMQLLARHRRKVRQATPGLMRTWCCVLGAAMLQPAAMHTISYSCVAGGSRVSAEKD